MHVRHLLTLVLLLSAALHSYAASPERAAAEAVARRLRAVAVDTPTGRYWPADVLASSDARDVDLGTGMSGVVMFWIGMHQADPNGGYLDEVRRGADYLAANLRTSIDPASPGEWTTGLYGPITGPAFALHEAYRLTGDERHREAALRLVDLLHQTAIRDANGASWGQTHDVLTGAAGTGLFLLYAANEMGHAASCDLARLVGRKLLLRGVPDGRGGTTWKASYEARFNLPNFSHGTAGIALFLASLYESTGDRTFLEGALAGARWLRSVADRSDGGFRIFYGWPDPGWPRRYDIGWAHGPAGTARLFFKLWSITGEAEWMEIVNACARTLRTSGLPANLRPEYGSSLERNQRFGTAGVARFFIDLHAITGDPADLELARALARDIIDSGVRESESLTWRTPRAPFMERPGLNAEFTGWFYGSAGYGLLFLSIDEALRGDRRLARFPDDPFRATQRSQ